MSHDSLVVTSMTTIEFVSDELCFQGPPDYSHTGRREIDTQNISHKCQQ